MNVALTYLFAIHVVCLLVLLLSFLIRDKKTEFSPRFGELKFLFAFVTYVNILGVELK